MILKRLRIDQLPGIDQPFEIESRGAGVHVILGPNAIGKSSICRAVEALYWEDRGSTERTSLSAVFELDGETWWARRDGPRLRWRSEGGRSVRPGIPGSLHYRCFFLRLRDLIDPSLDGTQDIASEIRRQMSGGFDLNQVAEVRFPRPTKRHLRRLRNEFNAAAREVQETEGKQSALLRREDERGALQSQLDKAVAAARRLPSVRRAIGLAGRAEEYETIKEKLAALPHALASLTGQERRQIEQHQARIGELDQRIGVLENQRMAARDAMRRSRLVTELNPSDLAIWRQNSEELARVELDLKNARTNCEECRREVASALSVLGGGEVDEVNLTREEHGRLFEFLGAASENRAQGNAVEWRLRLLASIEQGEADESRLAELRDACQLLRRWLRSPEVETIRDRLRARRVWLVLAAAIAMLGAALSLFVDPRFDWVLAAGAAVLVPIFLLRSTNPASTARREAEEALGGLATASPEAWNVGPVEARLREVEAETAAIESRLQRARDRDVERRSLQSELEQLDEAKAVLDVQRGQLCKSLKLDSLRPDGELVDLARAVDQLRVARIKYQGALGRVHALETAHSGLLSDLADALRQHGEPIPKDATSAGTYLGALSDRNVRLSGALADERQANAQLEQILEDRKAAADSIRQLYATASLEDGDMAGLTELLEVLPRYRELQKSASLLQGQISLYREEVAKAGENALAELDRVGLEALEHELSAAAHRTDGLRGEIADVNAQVKEARRGTGLQERIKRREDARAKLRNGRDEALFAEVGRFLLNEVEREYEQTQVPHIFERARSHFSAFTRHRYELRLGREIRFPRLYAIDSYNGENRELDELSDGTRAQLLLAARLAFAEEIEQGTTLPLFLDEALDQSDPQRFQAIASGLGRIATDQGRQLFYLTSDPLDRDRIRQALKTEDCEVAAEIDLGLLRRKADSAPDLPVPLMPPVPSPDGKLAEEYAIHLGVPKFAPALGFAGQHFFYVLPDDLNLLYTLLKDGIERAGQWKIVSGTALEERLAKRTRTSQEIYARILLLEVFCELWNQGRGRTVGRDALVQSQALSDRYLEHVAAIADDLNGDGNKLLAALRARKDPGLRGFRNSSAEALEEYLRESGYLDDRPILGESDLRLLALSSPSANDLPDGVAGACLSRWWAWAADLPVRS